MHSFSHFYEAHPASHLLLVHSWMSGSFCNERVKKVHCPPLLNVWTCSTVETLIQVSCDRCTQTKLSQFFSLLSPAHCELILNWEALTRYFRRDTWQSLVLHLGRCTSPSSWTKLTLSSRDNVCQWVERERERRGRRKRESRVNGKAFVDHWLLASL